MVFRSSLFLVAGSSSVLSLIIYDRLFRQAPFPMLMEGYLASCMYSKSIVKPLRDLLCIVEPFFIATVTDKLSTAIFWLLFNTFAPFSIWLCQQGGKPGRSALFSPILPILVTLVGQACGVGPTSAAVLPATYAFIKTSESPHQGVPTPPTDVYTFTNFGCHMLILGSTLGLFGISPTEMPEIWRSINYVWQLFPLFLLPLLLFRPKRPTKSEVPRSTNIFDFLRLASLPMWWANLGYALYLLLQQKAVITPAAVFLLYDFLGVLIAISGVYLIDVVSGDAKGLPAIFIESIYAGPPSAVAHYCAEKERQSAKRATVLKKAK